MTRIALPESDRYVFRLGAAVYGFASVSSLMAEVICHMDPERSRPELEAKMGGRLAEAFNQTVKKIEHLEPEAFVAGQQAYELFKTLNDERSDIIHSYPITSTTGNQILHRRQDATESRGQGDTLTRGKPAKHFEVTDQFMDTFLARLHQVNKHLYRIRDIFRPPVEPHVTVPEEDAALMFSVVLADSCLKLMALSITRKASSLCRAPRKGIRS
ncbi:hypothetical protein [Pseudomonas helleri]|uniref:hypothetical protein n=1 Tax=Pseudomonas helleri TaxID=1608996 RepID=UPI003FCFA692